MTDTSLRSIIKTILPSGDFKSSQLVDSQDKVRWIPIVKCWEPDRFLGISENGFWVVEEMYGLRVLNEPNSFLRIKILLEQPLDKIRQNVIGFFNTHNVYVDEDNVFPFEEIIRSVFEDNSSYWIELAFAWYEELPYEKKRRLKDSLSRIVEKKLSTQKVRQKAMREISKYNS